MMLNEPIAVTMLVIDALNALKIPYFGYLRRWAIQLGVADLLERILDQAQL